MHLVKSLKINIKKKFVIVIRKIKFIKNLMNNDLLKNMQSQIKKNKNFRKHFLKI